MVAHDSVATSASGWHLGGGCVGDSAALLVSCKDGRLGGMRPWLPLRRHGCTTGNSWAERKTAKIEL